VMAGVFMIVTFASIGLPGLNGFPGEFLSLLGAFKSARWWAVVGALGVIIAALYLLWAYQRVFHGPASGENATMRDLLPSELMVMAPLVFLMVFLGLYPAPMIERMEPSVKALVTHVAEYSHGTRGDQPEVTKAAASGEADQSPDESGQSSDESGQSSDEAPASSGEEHGS